MKPQFSTLVILTVVSVLLIIPFAFSPLYLDILRNNSFDLHQFLRGEIYKQGTGYAALVLVGIEMLLTLRKRSRGWSIWPKKLTMPGSVMLWRMVHIFTGTALVAFTLIHTLGAVGINYNAILLFSFFGVTFTALFGVVAETGILESPRKVFRLGKAKVAETVPGIDVEDLAIPTPKANSTDGISKGALIRGMRAVWLPSHIFLVSVFSLMLAVHIFLVYYYQ